MRKDFLFLDIGSSSIKGVVIHPEPETERFEVAWHGTIESKGVKRGVIMTPEQAALQTKRLINKAQEELQANLEVISNVNGGHLISEVGKGSVMVSRADNRVSLEDINRLQKSAENITLPPNYEVIWSSPIEYQIDGQITFQEPLNLTGSKIEAKFLVVAGFSPYLKNRKKIFLEAQVNLNALLPGPLAAGTAVTTAQEQDIGTAVIDLGAGTTSFVLFLEGVPRALGSIPVGSSHISRDIALEFQIPLEKAEEIKLQYGSVLLSKKQKQKIVLGPKGKELVLDSKAVSRVIEARVKEIVDLVYKEIKQKGTLKLPGGIILTGGGSKLSGIEKIFQKRFSLLVQKAENKNVNLLQNDPQFSVALGLGLLWWQTINQEGGSFSQEGLLEKILGFLKDLIP